MTFPSSSTQIVTTNLASGTANPSLARQNLLDLVNAVNDIIASQNSANGVMVLDGSGLVPSAKLPGSITLASGTQIINPVSRVVNVRDFLRIQVQTTAQILAYSTPQQGDIACASDGDAGRQCLTIYNGTDWRVLRFMTQLGTVGAALTAGTTLTCTAV
jgi:hypothetical protein